MSTRAGSRKARRGITLIELLVTMGILVAVIGMAGSAMLESVRSYALTRKMLDDQYNVSTAMLAISRELHRAVADINAVNGAPATLTVKTVDTAGTGEITIVYTFEDGELTQTVSGGDTPVLFVPVKLQAFEVYEDGDTFADNGGNTVTVRPNALALVLTGEYGMRSHMIIALSRFVVT